MPVRTNTHETYETRSRSLNFMVQSIIKPRSERLYFCGRPDRSQIGDSRKSFLSWLSKRAQRSRCAAPKKVFFLYYNKNFFESQAFYGHMLLAQLTERQVCPKIFHMGRCPVGPPAGGRDLALRARLDMGVFSGVKPRAAYAARVSEKIAYGGLGADYGPSWLASGPVRARAISLFTRAKGRVASAYPPF